VHANANSQTLRNLSYYSGVSNVLQGHTMLFSPNYSTISSCNILSSLLLLHVFFSRSRSDENQYSNDVSYLDDLDDTIPTPTDNIDLFLSCIDSIVLDHEYEAHLGIEEQIVVGCFMYENNMYSINQLFLLIDNSYRDIFCSMGGFFSSFVRHMLLWQAMYVFYVSTFASLSNVVIRLVYYKVLLLSI
jgi:hypothetical protein